MSPSRGEPAASGSKPNPPSSSETQISTETKANVKSKTALTHLRQNLSYLYSPSAVAAEGTAKPGRLRTRALLRSLHYLGVFVFWRVVRYAKYAVVGSVLATLGGGFMLSGVGWVLAPPGIVGSLGIGLVWAVGRWGFRKLSVGEAASARLQERARVEERTVKGDGQWRDLQGPRAVPW
ncbi:hypothetical protein PVAG01_08833 [Phlyctema vagabunda]|uniref:Uncharacterized protein n=1 Tax=Phlyctema vagabunda TaxID=108571 RepID=A0ABR4PAJ3_9HELO